MFAELIRIFGNPSKVTHLLQNARQVPDRNTLGQKVLKDALDLTHIELGGD